jgi:transcriptional regulator
MANKPSNLVQGTLEMLILKTLALEAMHGYGIAIRIEQISSGVFRVNPGSLFPALSRMERTGRIKAEWRATENNRRAKYYLLTESGRKAMKDELASGAARPRQSHGFSKPEDDVAMLLGAFILLST